MLEILTIIAAFGLLFYVTIKISQRFFPKDDSGIDTILGSGKADEEPKPPYQHDRDTK